MSKGHHHQAVDGFDNNEEIRKHIRDLPLKEKIKAVALNHYLLQKKKMDLDLEREIKLLQRKYDKESAPLFQKCNEIIEGSRQVTEEEIKELEQYLKEDEISKVEGNRNQNSIGQFWFRALKNSDIIAQEIKDKDEQILKLLTKIEYIPIEHSENFSLQFTFEPNDYFVNTVLKKTFILKDGENPVKSEGTNIEWKDPSKDVTKKIVNKKVKNVKSGKPKSDKNTVDAESFFNFFKPVNLEDKDKIDKISQEEMDKIAERMDIDYDIARMIIDEIIPYSLEYYLGVKINDDYDDIEDLDADSEESEGSDEEDDDKKKKGAKEKQMKGLKCKQQ